MTTEECTKNPIWGSSKRLCTLLLLASLLISGCATFSGDGTENTAQQDTAEAVRLKAVLLEAPDLAGSAIDVSVKDNRVLLGGFVETTEQRQRAEELIRDRSSIDTVTNRIQVK